MGGVPGVAPAEVVVIGGGVAGYNAARIAKGMGAARHRLRPQHQHAAQDRRRVRRPASRPATRPRSTSRTRSSDADLVIGAVLVPGAKAPEAGHQFDWSRI